MGERPNAYFIPSQELARVLFRKPHGPVTLIDGGYVACAGCRKVLNNEQFMNESCVEAKGDGDAE